MNAFKQHFRSFSLLLAWTQSAVRLSFVSTFPSNGSTSPEHTGKAWYEKNIDLWGHELSSQADFDAVVAGLPADKMLVVDYYAPWCAVCKTAYPAMCRLADDKDLKQHFVFAKASLEHAEVKEWVKAEGIRGIPHLSIYDGTAVKLLGMGASFKKVDTIKSNLRTIAKHKDAVKQQQRLLDLDPNFFVMIPGVPTAVAAST
ncbi:hypothetical protein OEZ86_009722 [Tetradesmus obliquus]|uniref:Thioredoxin domain-containing protein n=1 Tax=Tetradesmus obliquus TaxID=3088 RepID=A0ABY8UN53_TETOB|nr:hypothetical protein OEZ85_001165 [Tetradesmus obliquus]WIA43214.1 hypothetical protein OEZ86_009722 [Tetradesmus obliquus]